ncbi:hypothetical protein MIC448_2360007 [Microbacterium sp. C448]|nr:hypothetical protein MIC448_2360007 [Microbacterium sp. C448]
MTFVGVTFAATTSPPFGAWERYHAVTVLFHIVNAPQHRGDAAPHSVKPIGSASVRPGVRPQLGAI